MNIKKLAWSPIELYWIREAVKKIEEGETIYSQVKRLNQGALRYRTTESIRAKINKLRGLRKKK